MGISLWFTKSGKLAYRPGTELSGFNREESENERGRLSKNEREREGEHERTRERESKTRE